MAHRPKMGEIYAEYVDRCFKAGAMDFDDLLLRTNELLNRFPDVLAKYQDRFRYILVDEYQDTNPPSISLYVRFLTSFKIFVWWETMHRYLCFPRGEYQQHPQFSKGLRQCCHVPFGAEL